MSRFLRWLVPVLVPGTWRLWRRYGTRWMVRYLRAGWRLGWWEG